MLGAQDAPRARPLGVAVLAVVVAAFGVVTAVFGLFDVLRGVVVGLMESPRAGGASLMGGLGGLLLGAVYVVAGLGLWALRPWAWWLAVAASVVGLALSYGAILWMAAWAALLVYLVLVRAAFGTLGSRPTPSSA
ncbi:MAG TPA: hypothetical protein VGB42_01115 [Candidatus Thermoplasmatota archaeon]